MIIEKNGRIVLEPHEVQFIKDNFHTMSNQELADSLGLKLTRFRTFAYEMGLKKMELQYWTEEQVEFLKSNYKAIGDVELAEIFESKWIKNKPWTKKHIEKKRRYLKLKRTKEQEKAIKARNTAAGRFKNCPVKAWEVRGIPPVGTIRIWSTNSGHQYKVIKTASGFVHLAPFLWKNKYGCIPKGKLIVPKDGNSLNITIENLEAISREEHARRNRLKHDNYPQDLKQAIKLINKINKKISYAEQQII